MTQIALFHSVLGVRAGIEDAAQRLRSRGHQVLVVDQYEGRRFDDYDDAEAFLAELGGYPALMSSALAGVSELPDGFVCLGFSNGAGASEYVATQRPVRAVVNCSGALPLELLGADAWPAGVPAQLHYSIDDPKRHPGWAESLADSIRATAGVEVFPYAGSGHLFTDPSLPVEYDQTSAELFWQRALSFIDRVISV